MDREDSIYLREFTRRINSMIARGEQPDIDEIENGLIRDAVTLVPHIRAQTDIALSAARKVEHNNEKTVRRSIAVEWGAALGALGECLRVARFLNERFVQILIKGNKVLQRKDPRPNPISVSGAPLKCVILVALHARICTTSSEILLLLRSGFTNGAISRLRSLYELVIITSLIAADDTYEIVERYHDHAHFEELARLKIAKDYSTDPVWEHDPDLRQMLTEEIAEVEVSAQEILERWGPEIKEQYGWARPILPEEKREKKRIFFRDLEDAAGMSAFRSEYLLGNSHVHAGPLAAINQLEVLPDRFETSTRPRIDDEKISFVGSRTTLMIDVTSKAALKAISWESEEYDEFMHYFKMARQAHLTLGRFRVKRG